MKCLVIIPVFNEEEHIADVVRGALSESRHVVVVDDGSSDSTPEVLSGLGVRHIRKPHEGKGSALRAGFGYALENGYDWVITMDGDGQHDFREIGKFYRAAKANGTDMVVGSRTGMDAGMPFVRLATNRFMSRLISWVTGCDVPDTQCGFRAIRCELLSKVPLATNHYDTESELLMGAARAGFKVTSVPVATIYNGSKSNINKLTDTIRFVRLMCRSIFHG